MNIASSTSLSTPTLATQPQAGGRKLEKTQSFDTPRDRLEQKSDTTETDQQSA